MSTFTNFFAKSLSAVCWFATSGGDIGFSLICGFSLSIVFADQFHC